MIATAKRSSALPNVPTAAEVGLPGYDAGFYIGLWAPLKTPNEVIRRLSTETIATMKTPEVVEFMKAQGAESVGGTPEELGKWTAVQAPVWGPVLQAAGVKPE